MRSIMAAILAVSEKQDAGLFVLPCSVCNAGL